MEVDPMHVGYAVGGGGILGALTFLSKWAWNHTHQRIDAAEISLHEKASISRVESLAESLKTAFSQQREDNQRTFDEISKMTGKFEVVAAELGKRPTRDECAMFWKDAKENARSNRHGDNQ